MGGNVSGNPTNYNVETNTFTLKNPTKTGYIFTGWTSPGISTPQTNVTIPKGSTGNRKYTANWLPITYTVQYNGNGATGGNTANTTHTYDAQNNLSNNGYERKYTVSFNGNGGTTPSNKTSSYAFYRWRQYANATGWSFTDGQTNVGNLSSTNGATITLYAQWSPTSVTLPTTSRNAYSFAGWYYGTSRIGGIGDSYTPTSDVTLTAQWDLITKSISGTVNWNDQNNKYNSRPKDASGIETVDVTLNSDEPITETTSGAIATPNTQTVVGENYTFSNLQRYKTRDNTEYTYTVTQNVIPGYETVIDGYNITNNLILPTYNSKITYTPVNSFENKLLKNGKVKVTGEITADKNNRDSVGLNQGKVTFTIDSGISIDTSKIIVKYYEASTNTTYNLTNYTVNGNVITAIFGKDTKGISQNGDKITIELQGTLNKIGEYNSNIIVTGNLRDYRGTNTTINLGQVTNTSKTAQVEYQLPKANLKIQKVDSITNENLTDATFTLYEWNGSKYIQKEVITDTNKDGIYESLYYEWNEITNGKYRVEETGIPENYKDLKWSMQYNLNQLKTENYTVKPDYSNSEYNITYGVRTPDSYDNIDGIVENEPWKLKAKIEKVDLQTNNTIQSEAEFTIYEWNEENSTFEVYVSQTTGQEVKMIRQSDKTYLSGEWLYYTQSNKGKYRIIETKAPEGYFANYDEEKEKVTYDINVKETIETGKFEDQTIKNEGTVIISNNRELTLTNKRQKAILNITVVDKETEGKAQADSTLEGAKYGIYALENIYHADGITTRYEGTPGLIYKKDELIQTQITNTEGKFTFDDLECGKYYVKMIQAPEGYVLDENKYSVDFSYQGEKVELIEANGTIGIQVKKQAFQIYKLKEDSTILSNAGFSIYLVNDLSIVKDGKISRITAERYSLNDTTAQKDERIKQKQNADGTYYLKDLVDYYYKIVYKEGQEQILPGDSNVYHPYNLTSETLQKDYSTSKEGQTITEIRTNEKGYMKSPELAYGEYIVIETSVPRAQDATSPFVIKVEQDSRELQDIRFIKDDDFRTKVKIYIRDVQTQKTILNKTIQYVIKNIDTQEYMTQKIWVPNEGYVEYGTPDKPFETQKTGYIITPMKLPIGQYELIEITAAEGYTTNKFEGSSVNGEVQFTERDNVKFEINTNTAYYTDTYLGSYIIVVNETNKSVVGNIKIKAQGEYLSKAIIQEDGNYKLEYSNGNISEIKYQIIAKEDIYTQDNQGSKIYNKDEVIGYITTDENGEGIIENLPLGKYIIKEVENVEGFALNTETKEVEISYEGQEVPVVFKNVEQNEVRQKIEIIIHNKDTETDENRQGGKYGLYTKEEIIYTDINGNTKTIPANTLLQTTTANEKGEIKFNAEENIDLPQGKYYIKEIEAPEGYVLKEETIDIDTTKDNNKETILRIEKEIVGEKTSLTVQDINEQQNFVSGSKLEIVEKQTGDVVESWETEGKKESFRKLKTDTEYIIRQTKPADGYVTAEEVEFIIKTNGKVQINNVEQEENIINIISRVTKLDVILKDELDGSNASGVKLIIVNKETKEEITTWIMPNEPQRIEGLPIGNYTIKEIELPEASGYVTIEDVDFEIKDNPEIQQVTITQNVSKLEVNILDEIDSTKRPEGTKWQIVNKNTGLVVNEWVQDENKHEVKKLPIGNYTLREVELPEASGYVTNEDVDFEIKDTIEVQKVEVVQSVSKLEVNILDEIDSTKYAEGTKWQIVSKTEKEDGTIEEKVVDEWKQDGNKHEVKKLPIGNYTLREIELPEGSGYVTNEDVDFEIKDTIEVQKVEVVQSVSKLEVDILDELDSTRRPEGTKWQIISKTEKEDGTIEEKVVDEWKQDENKHEVKKLPIGNYTLREIELPEASGYVTNEDVDFEIKDTLDVQSITLVQSISKVNIKILDMQTEEDITESVDIKIVNKDTKEIVASTKVEDNEKLIEKTEEGYYIEKLPIGTYIIIETSINEEKGYVEYKEVEMEVKDTLEVQKIEIHQDISKLLIKVIDEETKEIIPEVKLQILDKETRKVIAKTIETQEEIVDSEEKDTTDELQENIENVEENNEPEEKIIEILETKEGYYIERLPIGEYILVQETKDGYHEVEEKQIKIENTKDKQEVEIINTRLQYDIKVDKQLEKIIFDGEETIINDTEARKVEVKERKIATADLKLQYIIRITNSGETDVKVGIIVDKLPDGFELVETQSNGWTMDKNLAIYKGYENEVLKPGETREVHITTKWKNSVTNFGDKTNIAGLINSSNPYGYEDKNKDNNEGRAIVVISVGTGIETAVTAARIVMVTFIGSMTICLIAGVEMLIKERKQKK